MNTMNAMHATLGLVVLYCIVYCCMWNAMNTNAMKMNECNACNSWACCIVLFPSLDGSVVLNEFDSTFEGIISSFITRYPNYDTQSQSLSNEDQHYWSQK